MGLGWSSGGAGITEIVSGDSSIVVTNSTGPVVDLSASASSVGALPLSGGTMTGDIDMGGGSVINERLVQVTTAVSTTTSALGLADKYTATASPITLTISTADIVDGRRFVVTVRDPTVSGGTPVTIDTEGGELIDGAASIPLENDYASVTLVARGGNLESEQ